MSSCVCRNCSGRRTMSHKRSLSPTSEESTNNRPESSGRASSFLTPTKKKVKMEDTKNTALTPLDFIELEKDETMTLHRLNCVTFSVHKRPYFFPVQFYRDLFKPGSMAGIVYYYTQRVGGCYCRLKPEDSTILVIMCIGSLPSLRRRGIGSRMMEEILNFAHTSKHGPKAIELNVQIRNQAAICLYKKFQFQIVETIENYYPQAEYESRDAYLMRRSL